MCEIHEPIYYLSTYSNGVTRPNLVPRCEYINYYLPFCKTDSVRSTFLRLNNLRNENQENADDYDFLPCNSNRIDDIKMSTIPFLYRTSPTSKYLSSSSKLDVQDDESFQKTFLYRSSSNNNSENRTSYCYNKNLIVGESLRRGIAIDCSCGQLPKSNPDEICHGALPLLADTCLLLTSQPKNSADSRNFYWHRLEPSQLSFFEEEKEPEEFQKIQTNNYQTFGEKICLSSNLVNNHLAIHISKINKNSLAGKYFCPDNFQVIGCNLIMEKLSELNYVNRPVFYNNSCELGEDLKQDGVANNYQVNEYIFLVQTCLKGLEETTEKIYPDSIMSLQLEMEKNFIHKVNDSIEVAEISLKAGQVLHLSVDPVLENDSTSNVTDDQNYLNLNSRLGRKLNLLSDNQNNFGNFNKFSPNFNDSIESIGSDFIIYPNEWEFSFWFKINPNFQRSSSAKVQSRCLLRIPLNTINFGKVGDQDEENFENNIFLYLHKNESNHQNNLVYDSFSIYFNEMEVIGLEELNFKTRWGLLKNEDSYSNSNSTSLFNFFVIKGTYDQSIIPDPINFPNKKYPNQNSEIITLPEDEINDAKLFKLVKNKFEISHNNHLIARIGDDSNPICQSCQYSLVGDFLLNQEFESLTPTDSSESLMTFGMVNLVAGPHNVNNMPLTEQKFNAETCLKKSKNIAPLFRFQLFSNLEITHFKNASNIDSFCSNNINYNSHIEVKTEHTLTSSDKVELTMTFSGNKTGEIHFGLYMIEILTIYTQIKKNGQNINFIDRKTETLMHQISDPIKKITVDNLDLDCEYEFTT